MKAKENLELLKRLESEGHQRDFLLEDFMKKSLIAVGFYEIQASLFHIMRLFAMRNYTCNCSSILDFGHFSPVKRRPESDASGFYGG